MNRLATICLLAAGWVSHSLAQNATLAGSISGADGQPIEGATVSLLRAADSSLVKFELSDAVGRFEFTEQPSGSYLVAATALGFERFLSQKIEAGSRLELPKIALSPTAVNLSEVAIVAQKPFIERRLDRTIVNVDGNILATGSSALDVLERSPGVIVSSNESVSLRGRSGVVVMVDGKPNPMSGADLANFLKTLPSSTIERIEIITNPSAKYDAAGNAGIIDIRLKKDKNLGTNGSLSTSYGQGVYPKAGGGYTLNHRSKRVNLFSAGNYNFRKSMNDLRLYRAFFDGEERTGAYDQRNFLLLPYNTVNGRVGADFYPDKKTVWGAVAACTWNFFDPRGQNTSTVEGPERGVVESYFETKTRNRTRWLSWAANANYKRTLDARGQELTADLDYAEYGSTERHNFTTSYTGLDGQKLRPDYLLHGDLEGRFKIRSAKLDWSLPLGGGAKLEAGAKSSVVDGDNDLRFFDRSVAGQSVYDSTISNHFVYRENINAAYLNASREWEKFSLQAGLRMENTNAAGTQLVTGDHFDRRYTNWFPSLFLREKFSKNYEAGLNMSRRLDRPSYQQLNPFKKFLDPSTYSAGNPFLNPQYTWSAELSQTFFQKITVELAASRTLDNITQVIAPVGGLDRVTVQTDSNLTTVDYLNLSVSYNFDVAKWWSTVNNFTAYQGRYSGNLANTPLRDGNLVVDLRTTSNVKLPKNWSAEANFSYHGRELYGFMDLNPMWGLGAGLQKTFLDRRATLKLAVTDIFWQNLPSATVRFTDYVEDFEVFRETRVATISFNYRFGSQQVQAARRRQGGAEEEKRRAGNGQG